MNISRAYNLIMWVLFSVPFGLTAIERAPTMARRISPMYNPSDDYGVTEWMINYQAGFVRRGLPGEFIHALHRLTGVTPSSLAVIISILLYIIFCVYLFRRSLQIVPRWALLSTPLLGFPIYINVTLVRKDILMLVLLALTARIIVARPLSKRAMLAASSILVLGVLSHEVFAFLALPSSAYLLYLSLRTYRFNTSPYPRPQVKTITAKQLVRPFILLFPSTLAFIAVCIHRGSLQQVRGIYSSWDTSISPFLRTRYSGGSISWLGHSTEYASKTTRQLLAITHYGIPYWLIVVLASTAGVILIGLAINSNERRELFLMFAILQFSMMLPIFANAWDQGRWIVLCISSSFILMIESNLAMRHAVSIPFHRLLTRIPQLAHQLWPLGLGLWGIPLFGWSLQGWLWTSPFTSLVLKPYFYLRTSGVPGPKQLLEGLLN
jgi:hypothetical protein